MTHPTSFLKFTHIHENQGDGEGHFNDAMNIADSYGTRTWLGLTNTPPGSPSEGDFYVILDSPTGAWVGHANEMTVFSNGRWFFVEPKAGLFCTDSLSLHNEFTAGDGWQKKVIGVRRKIILPISDFVLNSGTPTNGSEAFSNFTFPYWEFDSASPEEISTVYWMVKPVGTGGKLIAVQLKFKVDTVNSSDEGIRFTVEYNRHSDGDSLNSPSSTTTYVCQHNANRNTTDLYVVNSGAGGSVLGGQSYLLTIVIKRDTGHADDDYGGNVRLFGVEMEQRENLPSTVADW
jgi:hypothetical protein